MPRQRAQTMARLAGIQPSYGRGSTGQFLLGALLPRIVGLVGSVGSPPVWLSTVGVTVPCRASYVACRGSNAERGDETVLWTLAGTSVAYLPESYPATPRHGSHFIRAPHTSRRWHSMMAPDETRPAYLDRGEDHPNTIYSVVSAFNDEVTVRFSVNFFCFRTYM